MTSNSESRRSVVRGGGWARVAGTLAGCVIRCVGATLRMEVVDRCGITRRHVLDGPVIWSVWHNQVFVIPPVRNRHCRWRKGTALTSASKDGAILAAAVRVFGIGAVRGSTSRRGAAALKGLLGAIRRGDDVCVTPDGPRGPRYVLQRGVVKVAQASGAPIVPVHVKFESAWRLSSWDRFHVPKPFSRVIVTFDEVLAVPRHIDDDGFAAACRKLQEIMRARVDDFDDSSDADH